jgi:hypothetical protein
MIRYKWNLESNIVIERRRFATRDSIISTGDISIFIFKIFKNSSSVDQTLDDVANIAAATQCSNATSQMNIWSKAMGGLQRERDVFSSVHKS